MNADYIILIQDYMLDVGYNVEEYLCDTLNQRSYGKLLVKSAKSVAKRNGLKQARASGLVVDRATANQIKKQFKSEIDKNLFIIKFEE